MKNKNLNYHIFLFLSLFSRDLVEIFSLVLLYKKGFSIKNTLLFLLITYIIGIITCTISIKKNKKIVLIISNIIYGISYLYLSKISNSYLSLFILAMLLSFSNYSFHTIRHYYAIIMLKNKNRTNNLIIITYIAKIIAILIGSLLLEKTSPIITSIIILIISIISCIPIIKFHNIENNHNNIKNIKIEKNKIIFSILEQFKIHFLELQPLYLYLYIKTSYLYIGVFNIIMHISSLIVIILLSKHITQKKFKYITIFLGITLILKLNLKNKILLVIIALLEGVFTKIYEIFSLNNLYEVKENNIKDYLLTEEYIFLNSKSTITICFILLPISLKNILYIDIIGIIISGFFLEYKEK